MTNEITTPAIGSPAPANANANGDAQEQHNHAADYALDNFRRTLGHLDDLSWAGGEIAAEVLSFFEMELNPKTVEEIEQARTKTRKKTSTLPTPASDAPPWIGYGRSTRTEPCRPGLTAPAG
jgi:hypothetical protein